MYTAKSYLHNVLIFILVLVPRSLSVSTPASIGHGSSLSTQMLKSIISRGQGLALSTGKTSLIELGIFQSALRQSLAHTISSADCALKGTLEAYLEQSVESTIGQVGNASADIGLPLDRLSVGTGILEQ